MRRRTPLLGAACIALAMGFAASCSSGDAGPAASSAVDASAPTSTVTVAGTGASTSVETAESVETAKSVETAESVGTVETVETVNITSAPRVTAEAIAVEITAAERGIRDGTLAAEAVAAFGRRQQQAYQLLARNADLLGAATALMPADVMVAFGFNIAARQAVVDHAIGRPPSEPSATLPAWTIVDPRPVEELLADYRKAGAATGVPWEYLAAINLVETRMGRIRGESSAGALGPMQFLPTTWMACCTGDIEDPHDAILGAAVYLASQGAPADMHAALYGYNPNEGYVGAVTAYAANLMADPLAYSGYHAWEVYVGSAAGTIRLPVGYAAANPVDAAEYASDHPDDVT